MLHRSFFEISIFSPKTGMVFFSALLEEIKKMKSAEN